MRFYFYLLLVVILSSCNIVKELTDGKTTLPDEFFYHNEVDEDNNLDEDDGNSDPTGNHPLNCPSGYILVKNTSTIILDDFCVMKYEAKNDGSGNPISTQNGTPWVNINANDAASKCESIGSNYHLISNVEWMVIARDIENEAINWSGGVVGNGCIMQGNVGAPSICSYSWGSVDFGVARDSKASLYLSNNIIQDFSGNVAEFVDWDKDTLGFQTGPTSCLATQTELSSVACGGLSSDDYESGIPTLDSTMGSGTVNGGIGGATTRGGHFSDGVTYAGIYNLQLNRTTSFIGGAWGFRCVYRE